MAMLRMLGRDLHSNYGPTADTGGLMQNQAPTIYAYDGVEALLAGEPNGVRDLLSSGAARDYRGLPVDGPVPHRAQLVIVGVVRRTRLPRWSF